MPATLRSRVRRRITAVGPRGILAIGWSLMMLYAYPGFMSYDSVFQLLEARSGDFTNGHPPAMAALWQVLDNIIPGPILMLVLQVTCFQFGAYLVARHFVSKRVAAAIASGLLIFPPVAIVMAVIWKDCQMAAFLMLGTGLLMTTTRRSQLGGLAAMIVGTAMRHNALAITFPIVLVLFTWSPTHRWWQRYPLAFVVWLGLTLAAGRINNKLTVHDRHLWQQSLAVLDITGTLRYADPISDAELTKTLEGTPLAVHAHLQGIAQLDYPRNLSATGGLWWVTWTLFDEPISAAERDAITRAWKAIVLHNPYAYLTYRWAVFRDVVQLRYRDPQSAAYVWFVDVTDVYGTIETTGQTAVPGAIQALLREGALAIGTSWLFRVCVYLGLALLFVPFVLRDRRLLALLGSALSNDAALFLITPSPDYRYSFWLVLATVFTGALLIARRAGLRPDADAGTAAPAPAPATQV